MSAFPSLGDWLRRLRLYDFAGLLTRTVERLRRRSKIAHYLRQHAEPRLQLGSGGGGIPGWLNTDFHVNLAVLRDPGSTFIDLTQPLPLPSGSLVAVAAEHVIEHFELDVGLRLLQECHRVLRPGGILRLITPDLDFLRGLLEDPLPSAEHREYVELMLPRWWPHVAASGPAPGMIVFNGCLREWGHRFAYDAVSLEAVVRRAGFVELRRGMVGQSQDPALCGIDSRDSGPDARINRLESLVLEARRP